MQSGDTVQVRQTDRGGMWVYATVINPSDKGAFVQIGHPGNIDHGAFKFVPAAHIRTKADVEALIGPDTPLQEKRALQSQMDWLS